MISFFHHLPIDNPPQRLQMRGAPILIVKVVGVLPDIEGQERFESLGDGIACTGFLGDDEGAVGGGGQPDPAGAEEGNAFGDEIGLEGVEGAPLVDYLFLEMPGRAGHDGRSGFELREV